MIRDRTFGRAGCGFGRRYAGIEFVVYTERAAAVRGHAGAPSAGLVQPGATHRRTQRPSFPQPVNLARSRQRAARAPDVSLADPQALGEGARRPRATRLERVDNDGTDGNRRIPAVRCAGHPHDLTSNRLTCCDLHQGAPSGTRRSRSPSRQHPSAVPIGYRLVALNRLTFIDSGPYSHSARVRAVQPITARYNRLALGNPRIWACL
jgi:hypothetical protein